ncbi:unnamed protein product [Mytilus coruscus]|uniref:HAT C-terminal dimerisation domain-containing protein n=1 Tax=Mytilus coruscus TaxID=42192 RepID=A0A6J8BDF2_MYTCO|nr:unnamed protein product [Mytilus coruscus]
MQNTEALIQCIRGNEFEGELNAITTFYGDDFQKDNLRCQLKMVSANFESDCKREDVVFADIVKYVKSLSKGEKVWLNEVVKLIKLVLVMPATSATSERSFSSLRRMKSYLRSTMKQARLNSVMFLNVHKDKTDGLNIHDVAKEFVFKESRYNTFGKTYCIC